MLLLWYFHLIFLCQFNRTIRWLDRCMTAHRRPHDQNLFPIVQGGLYPELRKKCAEGNINEYGSCIISRLLLNPTFSFSFFFYVSKIKDLGGIQFLSVCLYVSLSAPLTLALSFEMLVYNIDTSHLVKCKKKIVKCQGHLLRLKVKFVAMVFFNVGDKVFIVYQFDFIDFFRIDQKGCARFCYWWIKWRRVKR